MIYLRWFPLTDKRGLFDILLLLLMLVIMSDSEFRISHNNLKETKRNIKNIAMEQARRTHIAVIDKYIKDRENWTTSVLGSRLFKFNTTAKPQQRRFIIHLSQDIFETVSPNHFADCSVKNCLFTNNDALLPVVDAVLFNLRSYDTEWLKKIGIQRNQRQRWIFMSTESPIFTFVGAKKILPLEDLVNTFNWSLTFRTDSDIPYPYGRTLPLEEPVFTYFDLSHLTEIIPNWKRKRRDVLVTIMASRCLTKRMFFLTDLKKYIPVDVYGRCSMNKSIERSCPRKGDCDRISEYLFYLALENSQCREYITEKIWHNAYLKGAIPIILGPTLNDCERLLPPNSYIYVPRKYNSTVIKKLAEQIKNLSEDDDALLSLHKWRNHFKVTFEYGTNGKKSILFCRLCEALNYNDQEIKIYKEKDMRSFLDYYQLCQFYNLTSFV